MGQRPSKLPNEKSTDSNKQEIVKTPITMDICRNDSPQPFPIPANQRPKLSGWEFYEKTLGSPRYVLAPMVDQSELAWRMLSRNHGAELCYSPMFNSNIFVQDHKYRAQALQSCPEDRPLVVQFCGNDPETLLTAGLLAQDHCDAIDINLGCPQVIAKRGHFGSFLQDEWDLLTEIVSTLHEKLSVPITCKIRIFKDVEKTIKYAQMLEKAGCQLLTVHGRVREQYGPLTGLADWSYIKTVRDNISIPMLANGNILYVQDVERCIEETGVQGVMTAEGNLHNPALFETAIPTTWDMAIEYLDLVEKYPCPASYIRGHLFKIFQHILTLKSMEVQRESMAVAHTLEQFRAVVLELKATFEPYHIGTKVYIPETNVVTYDVTLAPWLCQPYVRPEPDEHKRILAEKHLLSEDPSTEKQEYFDIDGNQISRKLSKKLKRVNRRPNKARGLYKEDRMLEICSSGFCNNPKGLKCESQLCKICCRNRCYDLIDDCIGHNFFIAKKLATKENFRKGSINSMNSSNYDNSSNNDNSSMNEGEL